MLCGYFNNFSLTQPSSEIFYNPILKTNGKYLNQNLYCKLSISLEKSALIVVEVMKNVIFI